MFNAVSLIYFIDTLNLFTCTQNFTYIYIYNLKPADLYFIKKYSYDDLQLDSQYFAVKFHYSTPGLAQLSLGERFSSKVKIYSVKSIRTCIKPGGRGVCL